MRDEATAMGHGGPRPWLLPAALLAFLLLGLTLMTVRPPRNGQHVAAMFPPWWTVADAVGAVAGADGSIVGFGALPTLIVVAATSPEGVARLRSAGAWMLFDASSVLGCGASAARGS